MGFIQQSLITPLSAFLWNYVLIFLLIGAGIHFGVRTRFVQFRLMKETIRSLKGSRHSDGGISPFQAFCIGLASRVGTGNITGVAIALSLGGPGAIFWMWVVALLGMATAFVEATLAQVFKVRSPDDTSFVGGPAYYIERGLGSRRAGTIFAVLLIFTFGVAFSKVQANTIADGLGTREIVSKEAIALGLVAMTAPVLFGGLRRIARVAEIVLPNIERIPEVLAGIVQARSASTAPSRAPRVESPPPSSTAPSAVCSRTRPAWAAPPTRPQPRRRRTR
jgi:AGCS family alanine or glycine:cation symporter